MPPILKLKEGKWSPAHAEQEASIINTPALFWGNLEKNIKKKPQHVSQNTKIAPRGKNRVFAHTNLEFARGFIEFQGAFYTKIKLTSHPPPKWHQDETKMIPRWGQDDTKMMPRWYHDDTKMTPTWYQDDTKMIPRWHQDDTKIFLLHQHEFIIQFLFRV